MKVPATALLRAADARGHLVAGGVDARHAFSRGDAIDRAWMGWGALRVLSTQAWAPAAAGETGRIANMELLLVVLEGRLRIDAAGFGRQHVDAGGVAWIGAGHGVECRLANASEHAPLRLVEAWIRPDRVNAAPGVSVRPAGTCAPGTWSLLACGAAQPAGSGVDPAAGADGHAGALRLRQDARVRAACVAAGGTLALDCAPGRRGWLQMLAGSARVDGRALVPGDALAWDASIAAPLALHAQGVAGASALLFELPG